MRIRVAAGAVLAVLGLFALSPASLAQPKGGAPKPAVHAAKPAAPAKPALAKSGGKPAAKPGKPLPAKAQPPSKKGGNKKAQARKSGDPTEPDEATRRIIAGLTAQRNVRESTELTQMRQVDLALFPSSSPDAGEPWQAEGSPVLATTEPKISASGLPPEGQLTAIATPAPAVKDLSWLKQLEMPDIPVRWDARVIRYLEFYKNDPRGKSMATTWIRKSGRYAGAIRRVLREQSIPEDILWLSLVESGFDPTIHSPAGAAGLWQFMPEGARIYGLYVDRWVDERHDPERSTLAAARYLSDLKTRFGTWELAFAAYNMGYGGLLAAIKKYNTNDFWELSKLEAGVPFETALYVPKIVAIAIVARNKATFGLDSVELDSAVTFDKVSVNSGVSPVGRDGGGHHGRHPRVVQSPDPRGPDSPSRPRAHDRHEMDTACSGGQRRADREGAPEADRGRAEAPPLHGAVRRVDGGHRAGAEDHEEPARAAQWIEAGRVGPTGHGDLRAGGGRRRGRGPERGSREHKRAEAPRRRPWPVVRFPRETPRLLSCGVRRHAARGGGGAGHDGGGHGQMEHPGCLCQAA